MLGFPNEIFCCNHKSHSVSDNKKVGEYFIELSTFADLLSFHTLTNWQQTAS